MFVEEGGLVVVVAAVGDGLDEVFALVGETAFVKDGEAAEVFVVCGCAAGAFVEIWLVEPAGGRLVEAERP